MNGNRYPGPRKQPRCDSSPPVRTVREARERVEADRQQRIADDIIRRNNEKQRVVDRIFDNKVIYLAISVVFSLITALIIFLCIYLGLNHRDSSSYPTGNYTYVLGANKITVEYTDAVRNDTLYIGMNELSEFCGITVSGDMNRPMYTTPNGDTLVFIYGEDFAVVNGYKVMLMEKPHIDNGKCSISVKQLLELMSGISISLGENNTVTVKRLERKGSTAIDPLYEELNFLARTSEPIEIYDEYEIFGDIASLHLKTDITYTNKYMDVLPNLKLVNKQNSLNEAYVPEKLTALASKYCTKNIELVEDAAESLDAMMKEIWANGYTDIYVTSGYRSYSYQVDLFERYIADEMSKDSTLTRAEAAEKVLAYSAYPGTSEHQSGLCADLISNTMTELDATFADNPVYEWLCQNAWKFGFILRYPEGDEDITGYDYEPWHYRFVGRSAAYEIYKSGCTLEEYVASHQ